MDNSGLQNEALMTAFSTVLQAATFAAVERLTLIIREGSDDDALCACDTLFNFALSLATPESDEG